MSGRRSFADVERETIVAERAGVLTLARARARAASAWVTEGEAEVVARVLREFAGAIAIGLHRDGDDPAGVRDAMRPVVKEALDG